MAYTIMIVDDSETIRSVLVRSFGMTKLPIDSVIQATNGKDALEKLENSWVDIVFTDINMPEMDGLTAYKEIHKILPGTGCVIISAEKDTTTLRTAMSIGVQEYLIKPFTVEELEDAVARVQEKVAQMRKKIAEDAQIRKQREAYLAQLAVEYAKSRRSDDKAIQVFEHLAENPQCEMRWIQNLAMIYIIRQKWDRLKILAEKVEKRMQQNK